MSAMPAQPLPIGSRRALPSALTRVVFGKPVLLFTTAATSYFVRAVVTFVPQFARSKGSCGRRLVAWVAGRLDREFV